MSLRKLIKDIEANGYVLSRQKGTHRQYVKDGKTITVPMKDGDKIGFGLDRTIRKQAGIEKG